MADVEQKAKEEKWGTPDALPGWVNRFEFYGDARVRYQREIYSSQNLPAGGISANGQLTASAGYINFAGINDNLGVITPNNLDQIFFNFTDDRDRPRARLRLGANVYIAPGVDAGFRLATGDETDLTSLNASLGDDFRRFDFTVDRVFLSYTGADGPGPDWLKIDAGRFQNPFYSTEMLWDVDLAFDGIAVSGRYPLSQSIDSPFADRSEIFGTIGAFPIDVEETVFDDDSSNDKWLYGVQLGLDHEFDQLISARIAASYYVFDNYVGIRNPETGLVFDRSRFDYTAPTALRRGNSLFPIRETLDATGTTIVEQVWGLASDFELINLTSQVVLAHFMPVQVKITADVVKNIGFDADEVAQRRGFAVEERTFGYSTMLDVGYVDIDKFGDWRFFGGYRYLERDAVVDAFSDSNFLAGSTNAKGWIIGGEFGVTKSLAARIRYFTADEIDGYYDAFIPETDNTPLGIDILQLDLQASF